MDFKSRKHLKGPKSLKSLAFDKKDAYGNNLLHRFVLNNCTSDNSSFERYIGAVLRSVSGECVNAGNEEGYTALHLAVKKQNYLMVKMLLTCVPTIDVNRRNYFYGDGKTALHMAVNLSTDEKDALAIVKCLVGKGAKANTIDLDKKTPLDYAVENKDLEIVKVLVKSGVNVCRLADSSLLVAIKNGSFEIFKLLVEHGCRLNVSNDQGDTPLHILAAKEGQLETIKVLVENDAETFCQNNDGDTPLHIAVRNGIIKTVKLLSRNCEALKKKNNLGDTPLHVAAKDGNLEIVKFLLKKDSEPYFFRNNDGDYPLHAAEKERHSEVVEFLQEKKIFLMSTLGYYSIIQHLKLIVHDERIF